MDYGSECSLDTGCELAQGGFLHRQQEEALIPLKEDLADWLSRLLGIEIGVEDFMDVLDTGVHVCKLAKLIQARAEEAVVAGLSNERVPKTRLRFKENARSGTWFARDNVANFIRWCRDYGVKEECLFETEGLVSHTTPRNFILCLLELGRMAYKYDMDAPCLVAMEKEIDSLEQASCNGGSVISGAWSPEPPVFESQQPSSPSFRIESPARHKPPPPHDNCLMRNNRSDSRLESPIRDSRIPLRKSSSTSSAMSNGTNHTSPSPSTTNRRSLTGDRGLGSPARGNSRSPARSGSKSPARSRKSMIDNGAMMMKDTQDMIPRPAATSMIGRSNCADELSSSTWESRTSSVGIMTSLSVQSTCTDNLSRSSSRSRSPSRSAIPVSTMTSSPATVAMGTDCTDSRGVNGGGGPCLVSSGTMTSSVDTRVNAASNTDSPIPTPTNPASTSTSTTSTSSTPTSPIPASTSPGTPRRRSIWRRSISPTHSHGATRIPLPVPLPVPVGTSAHGVLSSISSLTHGVSTNSLSSAGSGSGSTPTPVRRRASLAAADDTATPRTRRRRSSMVLSSGGELSSRLSQQQRRASVASTPDGETSVSTRRRASLVSSNGDAGRSASGTKTPRRRSMSARSDRSDELDKEVRRISGRCECPQCYQIDRLSEGKYRIGERVVFVRLLKGKHVMVRVGGGWDTLDHYLSTHDPCRVMEVRREPGGGTPQAWGGQHALTAADDSFLFIHGKYKSQTTS